MGDALFEEVIPDDTPLPCLPTVFPDEAFLFSLCTAGAGYAPSHAPVAAGCASALSPPPSPFLFLGVDR